MWPPGATAVQVTALAAALVIIATVVIYLRRHVTRPAIVPPNALASGPVARLDQITPPDEAHFRLLVESVQDYAIFMLDPEGRVTSWNTGAERLKGYSPREIVGQHFSIFYPDELRAEQWPEHELLIAARETRFEDEAWRIRKDGSRFWANVVITALRSSNGELIGFAKVTRDLTQRHRTETELRDAAGRLKAIVETAVDGIITIDEVGTIETINPATERIFGYAAEELIGRNVRMLMPQPYRREHDSYLHRYRRTGERRIIGIGREVVGRRKDGSEFPLDLAVSETRFPGRHFFTGIIRDITDRKRDEEALRTAKEEAEHANRAKDQFLAVMSHELRTPLNAVIGFVDLMEAGVYGDLTAPQEQTLARIRSSAGHLISIIDQVLSFARIEFGKQPPRFTTVRIGDILSETAQMIEPMANARGLTFITDIPPGETSFNTDPGMLRQILLNLLGNAVKFTARGEVRLAASFDGHLLHITVTDTGAGIPPEYLERIFEPFWQMDQTLTREFGGTGIGLSVVHRLVTALAGHIEVHSTAGEGTEFCLDLPDGAAGLDASGPLRLEPAAGS